MRRSLPTVLFLLAFVCCVRATAQLYAPTQQTNTISYPSTNGGVYNGAPVSPGFGYQRYAYIYPMSAVPLYGYIAPQWGWISTIQYFAPYNGSIPNLNLKIRLANTGQSNVPAGTYASVATGSRLVKTFTNITFNPPSGQWTTITLDTSFLWTGGNLLVLYENDYGGTGSTANRLLYQNSGAGRQWQSNNTPPVDTGTAIGLIPAAQFDFAGAVSATCSGNTLLSPGLSARATYPDRCRNTSSFVFVDGVPASTGYTYQWKSGPVGGPYTNVAAMSTYPCLPIAQVADTAAYVCAVTCTATGATATSSPVTVQPYVAPDCYCTIGAGNTGMPARTNAFELTGTALLDTAFRTHFTGNAAIYYSPLTNGTLPQLYKGGKYVLRTRGMDSMAFSEAWLDANADGHYLPFQNNGAKYLPIELHSSKDSNQQRVLYVSDTMLNGVTMMRFETSRYSNSAHPDYSNACYPQNAFSMVDYRVKIFPRPATNIAIQEIRQPAHYCSFSAAEPFKVLLYTNGTASLNLAATPVTLTAQMLHNGVLTPITYTLSSGTLVQDDTLLVTFPATLNMSDTGVYKITVQATMSGDAVAADNYFYDYYRNIPAKSLAIRADSTLGSVNLLGNFTGISTVSGNGWSEGLDSIRAVNQNSDWAMAQLPFNAAAPLSLSNQYHTYITLDEAFTYNPFGWLMTPKFKVTPNTRIRFRLSIANSTMDAYTKVYLRVSGDCENSWNDLMLITDTSAYANLNKEYDIPLSAFSGGQAKVAFYVEKAGIWLQGGNNLRFNDFTIYDAPANDVEMRDLSTPYNGKPFYCGQDSVRVTFRNKGITNLNCAVTPVTFKAYFRGVNLLNYTLSAGILTPYKDTTITLGAANMADTFTNAEFYVRAVCAADTMRFNDTVRTFITLTANPSLALPWKENFLYQSGVGNTINVVYQLPWKSATSDGWKWGSKMMGNTGYTGWENDLGAFINGSAYARRNLAGNSYGWGWMLTPKLTATPKTYIRYSAGMFNNSTGYNCVLGIADTFMLAASTDCGLSWTPIMTMRDTTAAPYSNISRIYTLGQYANQEVIIGFGVKTSGGGLGYLGIDWVEMDDRWRYNVKPVQYLNQVATPLCVGTIYQDSIKVKIRNVGYDPIALATSPVTITTTLDTGSTLQTFTKIYNTGTYNMDAEISAFMGMGHFSQTAVNHLTTYTSCAIDTTHSDDTLRMDIAPNLTASAALPVVNAFSLYTGSNLGSAYPGWNEAVAGGGGVPSLGNSLWHDSTFNHQAGNARGTAAEFYLGQPMLPGPDREGWIITPQFVPDSATYLSFINQMLFDSSQYDPGMSMINAGYLNVKVLSNCGYTSTVLYTRYGNNFTDTVKPAFSLMNFIGQPVRIGFQAFYPNANATNYPANGRYLQLDDINISQHGQKDLALSATFQKANGNTNICSDTAQLLSIRIANNGYRPVFMAQTPVQLTGTVTGPVSFSINKTFATGAVYPATSQSTAYPIAFDTITKLPAGVYTITLYTTYAADSNSANDTVVMQRTVRQSPVVNLGPDTVLCNGGSLVLNAGNPGCTYSWAPYTSASQTFTVTPAMFFGGGSGIFRVRAQDAWGCAGRDTIQVSIDASQWGFASDTVKYCALSQGRPLNVVNNGYGTAQYLWSTGATTPSINVSTPGYYNVMQTSTVGCIHRDTIYVAPLNNLLAPVNLGPDRAICPGGAITLTPGTQTVPVQYQWSNGYYFTNNSVSVNAAGTYSVTVTYLTNSPDTVCYLTDTILITTAPVPVVNLGPDTALCYGQSITLNAGNSGNTFNWTQGNLTGQTPTLTDNNNGTFDYQTYYVVNVTNSAGCFASDGMMILYYKNTPLQLGPDTTLCNGASLTLPPAATAAFSNYSWSTGSTASSITVSNPGTYWASALYMNHCTVRDTIVVTTGTAPVLNLPPTAYVCGGSLFHLSAGNNGGATYLWNTGSTDTAINVGSLGAYIVTATNTANGCKSKDTTMLTVSTPPQVSLGPDAAACGTASYTIVPVAVGAGTGKVWSDGSTGSSLTVTAPGNYWLRATDGLSCTNADTIKIVFSPAMTLTATPHPGTGNNGTAKAHLTGGLAPLHYLWSNGGTTDSVSNLALGSYTVTVTDSAGCTATTTITLSQSGTGVQALAGIENGIEVFPNPAHDVLRIRNASADKQQLRLTLRDVTGRIVSHAVVPVLRAGETATLNISGISPGHYELMLTAGGFSANVRVVIE